MRIGGQVRIELQLRLCRVVALTLDYIAPACGRFSEHSDRFWPIENQQSWQR